MEKIKMVLNISTAESLLSKTTVFLPQELFDLVLIYCSAAATNLKRILQIQGSQLVNGYLRVAFPREMACKNGTSPGR